MEKENKEIGWLLKEKYNGKPNKNFYDDVKRLKGGEPLDYVIGFTEFLGCKIDLSHKPLIPRPETEFWVNQALSLIRANKRYDKEDIGNVKERIKVLDLFSGSGCIGIAVTRHIPNAFVILADKSTKTIQQIKKNIITNKKLISNSRELEIRTRVIRSDVFGGIKGKFDYIFANPPYIPTSGKKKVQKSVLQYEPKDALFGGKNGLSKIKIFLSQAKRFLNPEGVIFMEFDPPQRQPIKAMLKQYHCKSWDFKKDQYGKWRWVIIK